MRSATLRDGQPGTADPKLVQRVQDLSLGDHAFRGYPVAFWDGFGEQGMPLRTIISEMGPLLLSRLVNLNDTQSGLLSLVFKVADDQEALLLDLKDLRHARLCRRQRQDFHQ